MAPTLAGELHPGVGLLVDPFSEVDVFVGDAGLDVGECAVGFGVGDVGEDPVVALPVEWPGARPVRVDGGELRGSRHCALGVFAEAVFPAKVGDELSDWDEAVVFFAP
ncbi:hypothetical protein [Streptomyces sp. NPDC005125]